MNLIKIMYTALDSGVKDLTVNRGATVIDFMLFSSLLQLPVSILLTRYHEKPLFEGITRQEAKYLLLRSLCGSIGLIFVVLGMTTLTLTTFSILLNCSPFFTALLAYLWVGDKMTCYDIFAMIGSFCGIIVIALADPDASSVSNVMFPGWGVKMVYVVGVGCCLVGAVTFSMWVSANRMLQNIHYSVVFFYGIVCDCTLTLLCMLLQLYYNSSHPGSKAPFTFTTNLAWAEIAGCATLNLIAQNMFIICN